MECIVTCHECGAKCRRDDNPIGRAELAPRRVVFMQGSTQPFTADFCDSCFDSAIEGMRFNAAARSAVVVEGEEGGA